MIDLNVVKAVLENNSKKVISQSSLKKIVIQNIYQKNSNFYLDYKISDLIVKIEKSDLPEEEKKELNDLLVSKVKKTVRRLKKVYIKIFEGTSSVESNNEDKKEEK